MKPIVVVLIGLSMFVSSVVPSAGQSIRRPAGSQRAGRSKAHPAPAATPVPATPSQAISFRQAARQNPVLAEWLYQEMEPMGAAAMGLGLDSDPDASKSFGEQLLAYTTFMPDVIGSQDVIVHSATAVAAESETSIAVNATGLVLIAGYNDGRGFNTSPVSLSGVARSTDGGATWAEVPVGPGGAGTLPSVTNGSVFGDPDVKYDPTRNVFVYSSIYVRPSDSLQGICISTSNADGSVWSAPIEVSPTFITGDSADKELIDINPNTGRILLSWTDFTATNAKIRSTFSDDLGVTWSAATTLVTTGGALTSVQGAMPAFLPGPTNATSTAYIAWNDVTSGLANIGMSRSVDGGATWSAVIDIDSSSFPLEDQVLGVDRVNHFPSMAVDNVSGRVYVVYQRNNSVGEGDIALRTFVGAVIAGVPIMLDSSPGADRAQFMPEVTVDQVTHRVHVSWQDQQPGTTGELTEAMHTFSNDSGTTWAPPTPLLDRPYHAGYGNDTSQPNLGDYNVPVAQNGKLHSLFGATSAAPRYDEGQPGSAQMFTPDVYYDQRLDSQQVAPVRLGSSGATFAEINGGPNGFLDPGESANVFVPLNNYVTNATVGATTITGINGTLSTTTPGVTVLQASSAYASAAPGATVNNTTAYRIKLDNAFVVGTPIDLLLSVSTTVAGSTQIPFRLTTGTPGTATTLISENFDGVTAPALPAGWTTVSGGGGGTLWVTSATMTGSNAAFHDESATLGFKRLFSPLVAIPTPASNSYVTLDFDVTYRLEDEPTQAITAYDGLTVRVTDQTAGNTLRSIFPEAFAESILTATSNHYPKHLVRSSNANYFQDNSVWSGNGGTKHISMRFPSAGMVGRSVQLRFEYTQDSSGICTDIGYLAPCGVAVDNVVFKLVPLTNQAGPTAAPVGISGRVRDSNGSGIRGARVTITDSRGNRLAAVTNAFGYYSFAAVQTGDMYVVQPSARGYVFGPKVVSLNDAISDLDFAPQ